MDRHHFPEGANESIWAPFLVQSPGALTCNHSQD